MFTCEITIFFSFHIVFQVYDVNEIVITPQGEAGVNSDVTYVTKTVMPCSNKSRSPLAAASYKIYMPTLCNIHRHTDTVRVDRLILISFQMMTGVEGADTAVCRAASL